MTDIRVLLYLLRSDTTSLAWAKEQMIEAADEIERLCAISDELVEALEKITHHFADVMSGPFLAGVTFKNGVEGIPTIAAARAVLAKAKREKP